VKNAKNSDDARALATDDTSGEYIYMYIYTGYGGPPGDMTILKLRKRN